MILRYIVEIKSSPTFTVTKKNLTESIVDTIIKKLKWRNERAGYMKYSGFRIYDDNNNELTTTITGKK